MARNYREQTLLYWRQALAVLSGECSVRHRSSLSFKGAQEGEAVAGDEVTDLFKVISDPDGVRMNSLSQFPGMVVHIASSWWKGSLC